MKTDHVDEAPTSKTDGLNTGALSSSPEDLARLVYQDELTNVYNRRYFNQVLRDYSKRISAADKKLPTLSLLMIDLDHFKEINDTHGHTEGDYLLTQTAATFKDCVGELGLVVRYAGDEFAILLPDKGKSEATALAEKILGTVSEQELPRKSNNGHLNVSLSIGVATIPEDARTPEKLLEEADAALYVAKKKGRGAVSVSGTLTKNDLSNFKLTRGFPCPALVGRNEELSLFRAALPNQAGGQNRLLLIHGQPGTGKSRLLTAYFKEARRKKRPVVMLVGQERDAQQPYHVMSQTLRALILDDKGKVDTGGLESHHLAQLRWLLPDLLGDEGRTPMVGVDGEEQGSLELPQGGWGPDFLLEAFELLINQKCQKSGLTLLFDDARWMDPESFRVLTDTLMRRRASLLLVTTVPGDEDSPETETDSEDENATEARGSIDRLRNFAEKRTFEVGVQKITLCNLDEKAVASMCRSIFPGIAMASDSASLIATVTQGNPLYAEEILKNLLGRERIVRAGTRWKMERITLDDLPATLEDAIRYQLTSLDSQTMEVIQNAAAIGSTFDVETLTELSGRPEGEVREMIDRATEARVLRPTEEEDELSFYSSTIHKVSEESIDAEKSKTIHEKIAKFEEKRKDRRVLDLFVSRLAYHYGRSANETKGSYYQELSEQICSKLSFFEDLESSTDSSSSENPEDERDLSRARRRIREGDTALNESQMILLADVLRFLSAALKNRKMYPVGSRIAQESMDDLYRSTRRVFEEINVFTLADSPHGLLINGVVPDRKLLNVGSLEILEVLQQYHIRSITITSQVKEAELSGFIDIVVNEIPDDLALTSTFWDEVLDRHEISHLVVDQRVYVVAGDQKPSSHDSGGPPPSPESRAAESNANRNSQDPNEEEQIRAKIERLIKNEEPIVLSDELKSELPSILDEMILENKEDRVEAIVNDIMLKMKSGTSNERLDSAKFLRSMMSNVGSAARTEMNRMVQDQLVKTMSTEEDTKTFRELAEIIRSSVNDFVEKGEFEYAARAVHALKKMRGKISEGNPHITDEATRQLKEIADSATFEVLLADLVSGDAKRQGESLKILTGFGDIAVAPLLQVIREREDFRIRKYAALILAELGSSAVDAVKTKLSLGTPDAEFRRLVGIIDALPGDFTEELGEALKHPNKGVRTEAAAVVNRMRVNIDEIFSSALDHSDASVVAEAIAQLGKLGRRDSLEEIRVRMNASDNPELLHEACIALGRIGDPRIVPDLERVLTRTKFLGFGKRYAEKVRYAAAWALGRINTPESIDVLEKMKKDRASMVRNFATERLSERAEEEGQLSSSRED